MEIVKQKNLGDVMREMKGLRTKMRNRKRKNGEMKCVIGMDDE